MQSGEIAHLIQAALTPIFLISAVGVILNVLISRLGRIIDRGRTLELALASKDYHLTETELQSQIRVLAIRARYVNRAITLTTVSALCIALVVVMLFMNPLLSLDVSRFIALMFIASMLSLAIALLQFLIEVRIATASLRLGINRKSAASD